MVISVRVDEYLKVVVLEDDRVVKDLTCPWFGILHYSPCWSRWEGWADDRDVRICNVLTYVQVIIIP